MNTNQTLSINIPVPNKGKWSSDAIQHLKKGTETYTVDVINEAYRIGMSKFLVVGAQEPEITAKLVEQAEYALNNFSKNDKRPFRGFVFQFCAFTSSTLTGGLFDTKEFSNTSYVVMFLVIFLIAILSHLVCFFNDK